MNFITIKGKTTSPHLSFFNASSSYLLEAGELLELKIDIDKKHIIQDIQFATKAELSEFDSHIIDALIRKLQGQKALNCLEISWLDLVDEDSLNGALAFFNIPMILLNDAITHYFGKVPSFNEGVSYHESGLVCRCFGIYKEQAQNTFLNLGNNGQSTFKDFCSSTKATLGCGSCHDDFATLFEHYNKSELSSTLVYHDGLGQSEFALVADEFIKQWLDIRKLSKDSIEIVDIHHYSVFCKVFIGELEFYKLCKDFEKKFKTQLVRYTLQ